MYNDGTSKARANDKSKIVPTDLVCGNFEGLAKECLTIEGQSCNYLDK